MERLIKRASACHRSSAKSVKCNDMMAAEDDDDVTHDKSYAGDRRARNLYKELVFLTQISCAS